MDTVMAEAARQETTIHMAPRRLSDSASSEADGREVDPGAAPRFVMGLSLWKRGRRGAPSPRTVRSRGEAVKRAGRIAALLIAATPALSLSPLDTARADIRAFAEACSDPNLRPDRRVKMCNSALAEKVLGARGMAQVMVNRGASYVLLNRLDLALTDYDDAARLAPDLFEIWPDKGYILLEMRRFEDAFQSFQTALSLRPNDQASLVGRGRALLDGGAPVEALSDFTLALTRDPDDLAALRHRARAYARLGDPLGADADLTRLVGLAPEDVLARLQRADLYAGANPEAALIDYEAAMAIAPDDPRAFYLRGRLLDQMGRAADANRDLRRAYELGWRDEWLIERMIAIGGR